MMAATHKLVGGSSGFIAAAAATMITSEPMAIEVAAVVLAAPVAAASSSLPDSLEDLFRLPHRRVTHFPSVQLLINAALAVVVIALSPLPAMLIGVFFASVFFGCLMHSCVDAMTIDRRGIQLAWPISRRGYHLLPRSARVKVGTDSRSEKVFALAWCALMVTIVLSYSYARFRHNIHS